MLAGDGHAVHGGHQLRAHIAFPEPAQSGAQGNTILQGHHPMDTHPACREGRLRLADHQSRELVDTASVHHIQMLGFFRQKAHDGKGPLLRFTVNGGDGKLDGIADGLAEFQNIQCRGFQSDLTAVLREPSGGGRDHQQLRTGRIIITQMQTASLHRAGHIGMTDEVESTQLYELSIVQNFIVQHHHIHDSGLILPVVELGIYHAVDTQHEGGDQKNRQEHADGQA